MIEQALLQYHDRVSDFNDMRPEEDGAELDRLRRDNVRLRQLLDERADERISLQALID